jgi:dTDP-4-dehydrorhamnose 3,5-epimerase
VDLRRDSPSYGEWLGLELTADNYKMLYVPEGCAHGYLTLSDAAEVAYQVSEFYAPAAERGIRWDDPWVNIAWPGPTRRIISDKDAGWPDYEEA